jgi:hypothetical protein
VNQYVYTSYIPEAPWSGGSGAAAPFAPIQGRAWNRTRAPPDVCVAMNLGGRRSRWRPLVVEASVAGPGGCGWVRGAVGAGVVELRVVGAGMGAAGVVRVPAGGGAVQEGGGGRWCGRRQQRRRGMAWEAAAARLAVGGGGGEAWRRRRRRRAHARVARGTTGIFPFRASGV